ncbi:MAG: outer membrane lipoprotein chaperone LolA [Proteobacteria bacterium]|nr:outer membrane lipoprotein chaperone LolA [Pseudomonadota bacterium]
MNSGFLVMRVGRNFAARGLFLLLGFCVANASLAQEFDAGQQLLHDFVNDVKSLSARFEQSLIDANGDVLETASGTVDIRRPGRFRWTYLQPYEQHLVADGLNVWSYDVDLAQVTVNPQAELLRNTPALLLGGADNVLDDFDYMGSYEDRGTVWVRLKPGNSAHGFSKVELGFTDGTLSRMMFDDALGQTTLIALLDVTINKRQADEFFVFVLPDDVDLVGVPVIAVPDSAADR